jgi:hypothetical protein
MSLGKFIDEQIRNSIEAGDFDNLEGAGRPIDLDSYFNTPEDLRMGYSVLKSSKFVPEEDERLKEIGELKDKILQERQLAFSLLMERNKLRR